MAPTPWPWLHQRKAIKTDGAIGALLRYLGCQLLSQYCSIGDCASSSRSRICIDQAQVETHRWPIAIRKCHQCFANQVHPTGLMEPKEQEGEVIRPATQPIDLQIQRGPFAREAHDRTPMIFAISRSMGGTDSDVGHEGMRPVALGKIPDVVLQSISPGRSREQPQREREVWL